MPPSAPPLITVIIPTYQEAAYVDRCLTSLIEGSWPLDRLEILVADGGSTDGTRERVEEWARRHGVVRLVENPDRYVPHAFNRGIQASRGEVIAIMGAHAEADPRWLERVWEDLQEHPEVAGVGGRWEIVGDSRVGEALALAQSSRIGVGQNSYRNGGSACYADTIIYGAYRREIFQRHGMFDEEMVRDQDDEFNIRLLAAGEKLWYDPRIGMKYYGRGSYARLWQQYYQYGFWKVRVWQKVGRLGSWRQFAPMAFVAGGLASLALLPFGGAGAAAGAGYWALYGAAVGAGSLLAARRRVSAWPLVAGGVVVLHASYGLGFWEGLLRFGLMRRGARAAHVAANR
jgi:glycosyltransferase involved in cell wall biosynthesis